MHIQTNSTQLFKLCGSSGILTAMVASFCAAGLAISLYAGITVSSRVFLASCIIVVFGVATCWVLFHKTEITLNRASDTVTVSKRMQHRTDSFDMPLSQVAQADVDIQTKQAKGQNTEQNSRIPVWPIMAVRHIHRWQPQFRSVDK